MLSEDSRTRSSILELSLVKRVLSVLRNDKQKVHLLVSPQPCRTTRSALATASWMCNQSLSSNLCVHLVSLRTVYCVCLLLTCVFAQFFRLACPFSRAFVVQMRGNHTAEYL